MAAPQYPNAVKRAQAASQARQAEAQLAAQQAQLQVQRAQEDATRALQDTKLQQQQSELADLMAMAEARQGDEETAGNLEAKRKEEKFKQEQKAQQKRGARSPQQDALEQILAGSEVNGRNLNQTNPDYQGRGGVNAVMDGLGQPGGPQPGSPGQGGGGPSVQAGGQTFSAPGQVTSTQTTRGQEWLGPAGPFGAYAQFPTEQTTTTSQDNVMTPAQVLADMRGREDATQGQANVERQLGTQERESAHRMAEDSARTRLERTQLLMEGYARNKELGLGDADAVQASAILMGPVNADNMRALADISKRNPNYASEAHKLTVDKLNAEIRGANAQSAKYEAETKILNGETATPSDLFGMGGGNRGAGSSRSTTQELGTLLEGLRDSRNADGEYDPAALSVIQHAGFMSNELGNPLYYPDADGKLKVVPAMQVYKDIQALQQNTDPGAAAIAANRLQKLPWLQVTQYGTAAKPTYDVNFTNGPDGQYEVIAERFGFAFGTGSDTNVDIGGSALRWSDDQERKHRASPGFKADQERQRLVAEFRKINVLYGKVEDPALKQSLFTKRNELWAQINPSKPREKLPIFMTPAELAARRAKKAEAASKVTSEAEAAARAALGKK